MSGNQAMIKTLTYIEEHIREPIDLLQLAKMEGYSVPQFYRIFYQLMGTTIGEYIVRRKAIQTAIALKQCDYSITEIAYQYGFESLDVYTRSFRRVYGVTPSEYRKTNGFIPPLKQRRINEQSSSKQEQKITYSLKEIEGFQVAGMRCKALTWDENGAIAKLWNEFLLYLQKSLCNIESMNLYGICEYDGEDSKEFSYIAAVGMNKGMVLPPGLEIKKIRTQKYLLANVPHDVSIPQAYTCAVQYARSISYELDQNDEIEVYGEFLGNENLERFQLLIPIRNMS